MDRIVDEIVAATPRAIDAVAARLPKAFPSRVFDAVTTGLRKSAAALRA